jgi:hypothetical protein
VTLRDLVALGTALAGLTPIVLLAGFWWLGHRLADAEARLDLIEKSRDDEPSRLALSKDIGKVAERVGRVEATVEGFSATMKRVDDYLHTLIEKGLSR